MSEHSYKPAHDDGAHPHVTPPWLLLAVFFGLITLTGLTVVCSDPVLKEKLRLYMNRQFFPMTPAAMSRLSLWVALIIATCKATLVALYFMHLRWDKPINGIVAISAFVFVALFIGFAMSDTVWARNDAFRGNIYNDQEQAKRVDHTPGTLSQPHEAGAGDHAGDGGAGGAEGNTGGAEGGGGGH